MVSSPDEARALLGVDRRATVEEVRSAYRRLARVHHPDAGGDVATFQELTVAMELLSHPRMRASDVRTSPSTGRRAYPSTVGQYASAAGARFHTGDVDTSAIDATPLPDPAQAWSRDDLARAVAADLTRAEVRVPLVGLSRRPGSFLNRHTRHLSDDLLSRWRIEPASRRGMPGHDLEVVARLPSGARKHVDRASLPPGWSTVRRPGSSESTLVVHPARDPLATAVLAADAVSALCDSIGWPLAQWRLPA